MDSREWGVYMLQCADGTVYTGVTNRLARRIAAHNDGSGARYTRSRRPVTLIYWEPCTDRGTAQRREAKIRTLPRAAKLALAGAGTEAGGESHLFGAP